MIEHFTRLSVVLIFGLIASCAKSPNQQQLSPSTSIPIYGMTAANNYIYLLGDFNDCIVSYAAINPNGSLGAWQRLSCNENISTLLGNNDWSIIDSQLTPPDVVYSAEEYLYLFYIYDPPPSNYNIPIYTPLNQDGSLGNFSATTPFAKGFQLTDGTYFTEDTGGRIFFASLTTDKFAYIIGGTAFGSFFFPPLLSLPTIYAPVNSDGSLGTWISTSSIDCTYCNEYSPFIYNNRIYLLRGVGPYLYSDIRSDGSLTGWNLSGTTPTDYVQETGTAVIYNAYIYLIAATSAVNCTGSTTVEYVPINSDGSIGTWQSTTTLNEPRCYPHVTAYNGYIYVAGGIMTGNPYSIEYAPINADGTVGKWQITTPYAHCNGDTCY